MLDDYALGETHPHCRIVVEAHLDRCARCHEAVESAARLGGLWLRDLPEQKVSDQIWARIDAALTVSADAVPHPTGVRESNPREPGSHEGYSSQARDRRTSPANGLAPSDVPASLEPAFALRPRPDEPIEWFPVAGSQTLATLVDHDQAADRYLYLLRVPAGSAVPEHEHLGPECLTVVTGAYRDDETSTTSEADGYYRTGDYVRYAAGSVHRPVADPEVACWAVVSVATGFRFAS